MITTTHAVVNAAIARTVHRTTYPRRVTSRAFLIGGITPDLALAVLSIGAAVFYPLIQQRSLGDTFDHVTATMYFDSPLWVIGHNLLHSPLSLALLLASVRLAPRPVRRQATSFLLGCCVHAVVDVAVHHDDGPLLLFTLDWTTRWHSPLSYWDPEHYAALVRPVDLAVTGLGAAWLAVAARRQRRTRPNQDRAGRREPEITRDAVPAVPR